MISTFEQVGATLAFNSGALAIGTTNTYSVAAAVNYTYRGVIGQVPITSNQVFTIEPGTGILYSAPNAFQPVPAGGLCTFLIVANPAASNALTVVQGPIGSTSDLVAEPPPVPSGRVAIGAIKVSNASASNFVPGTTNLNAASITATYFNLASHPGYAL